MLSSLAVCGKSGNEDLAESDADLGVAIAGEGDDGLVDGDEVANSAPGSSAVDEAMPETDGGTDA